MNIDVSEKHILLVDDATAHIVSPSGYDNNHIKAVDVFSADDSYNLLAGSIRCFVDTVEKTLITYQTKNTVPHQVGRLRYEPAVRITLVEESGEDESQVWYLYVYHHKGTVSLRSERANKELTVV